MNRIVTYVHIDNIVILYLRDFVQEPNVAAGEYHHPYRSGGACDDQLCHVGDYQHDEARAVRHGTDHQ